MLCLSLPESARTSTGYAIVEVGEEVLPPATRMCRFFTFSSFQSSMFLTSFIQSLPQNIQVSPVVPVQDLLKPYEALRL